MIGAVVSMALLATADPPPRTPAQIRASGVSDPIDDGGQAPGVYSGPDAHEDIMRHVFDLTGDRADLFDPDNAFDLILAEPIRDTVGDDTVTGYHLDLGDTFTITTPVILTIPGDDLSDEFWTELEAEMGDDFDDLVDLSFQMWMGTMNSSGEVPCGGIALTWTYLVDGIPEDFCRISPTTTWHDWDYGLNIITIAEDYNEWTMEMNSGCEAQDAEYDSCVSYANLDRDACVQKINTRDGSHFLECITGGMASCISCAALPGRVITCPLCVGGIACSGHTFVKWMTDMSTANTEWDRARDCCCLQAIDRKNGIPPQGDCSFTCPVN